MDDVAALDVLVLAAQPRIDPEGLDAHDLLLLLSHRAGHVHHVDDDGVVVRFGLLVPRPVHEVIAHGHDDGALGIIGPGGDLPLERSFEGPADVLEAVGTARADARVFHAHGLVARTALGLDIRQLKLFAQDLSELLQLNIDLEGVLTRGVAGFTLARAFALALANRISWLSVTLAHPAVLSGPELEAWDVDRRHRDADGLVALLPDHPPAMLRWRKKNWQIGRATGPERIGPRWWDTAHKGIKTRDYYRVETNSGMRLWVYREGLPERGEAVQWFVHGCFS